MAHKEIESCVLSEAWGQSYGFIIYNYNASAVVG
jgi:hypothetical protein